MSNPEQLALLLHCDAARNEAYWRYFLNSEVTTFSGFNILRIADWARAFVVNGLVPMMKRAGFIVRARIDAHLLYWLYSVSKGSRILPSPKHRNLEKDRWIFEQKIGDNLWKDLIDSYGVFELFDEAGDPYIRNTLSEFVYIYIIPEESSVISRDDIAENKVKDEEKTYYSDDE